MKLVSALGFDPEQAIYFETWFFFNQARSLDEKNFYYEKLLHGSGKSTFRKMEGSQLQIFRHWYTIPIREMLNLSGFRGNASWISDRLLPPVGNYEVGVSLKLLLDSRLIRKTANGYKASDPDITTDDEVKSFLAKNYHARMMKMATWAQEEIPVKERDISSACFAIKESELFKLKKQLQLIRKELRNFAAEDGTGERIVQVNMQFSPLTKGK